MGDAVVQKMQRKNRFSRTRGATDQRAAANRQTAMADVIKALDPCRELLNLHLRRARGS